MSTQTDLLTIVKTTSENLTTAKTRRDAAIVEAHRSGASFASIATAAGLTHPGVIKIVKRAS